MSDFDRGIKNIFTNNFCDDYDLINLIREPTFFRNPENPSCFDLIFTDSPEAFSTLVLLRQV